MLSFPQESPENIGHILWEACQASSPPSSHNQPSSIEDNEAAVETQKHKLQHFVIIHRWPLNLMRLHLLELGDDDRFGIPQHRYTLFCCRFDALVHDMLYEEPTSEPFSLSFCLLSFWSLIKAFVHLYRPMIVNDKTAWLVVSRIKQKWKRKNDWLAKLIILIMMK